MAFRCGFFTSVNGDRKYGVDDINKVVTNIVSEGVVADDKYSDGLQVQAYNGLEIVVKKGCGLFFNKWCELDSDMIFTVPTPEVTATRVDSIVIKIDISDEVRNGFLEYKIGESNTAPELINTSTIKEFRLANITVASNATTINQLNIEDTRPSSECGFVTNLLQNSDISATYAQWQNQFDEWYSENKSSFDTWFESSQNAFNDSQEQNQNEFNQTQEQNQNTFNETQIENQNEFDAWFSNVRETLSSSTLLRSFTSRYVTTEQDEFLIPIGIPEYKSVLDVLQVYINGLLCFEGTDYTIDSYNNVTLTKSVDKDTEIHFIVYKSMDGTGIDKFILDVDNLIARQDEVETKFNNVETKVTEIESGFINIENGFSGLENELSNFETSYNTFKSGINTQINAINDNISSLNTKTNTNATNITKINTEITNLKKDPVALWTGANTMGDGVTVTPSKKLSACKNGWVLIWCGYNTTDEIATNTRFNSVVVPKALLASIPGNYMPFYCNLAHNVYTSGNVEYNAKMVQIWDDKITGFAGNTATDAGKGFCLKQVIEF